MPPPKLTANFRQAMRGPDRAIRLHESIYQAIGFGNTMMVTTREGNVVIDTSWPNMARRHARALKRVNPGPVRYILLTHTHSDHTGGIPVWQEPDTRIVVQRNSIEFRHYQTRLKSFLAARNAAQFAYAARDAISVSPGNYAARSFENAIYFDDRYAFTLGGIRFEMHHTPGETPDHATVWIPAFRVAFTGDNFYESFPNLYTLRGTQPRWALQYVESMDKVLALRPEIVVPSHGPALRGVERIQRRLKRYRDAILCVHDAVVRGMNEGKDVYTLMREIRLPPQLREREIYGRIAWNVRGIYEGYAGWFDTNPSTMYGEPPSAVYPDLVRLAGGAQAVLQAATVHFRAGRLPRALRLTEAALSAAGDPREALELRLSVLRALRDSCDNSNELGWLEHGIRDVVRQLDLPVATGSRTRAQGAKL